MDDKMQQPTEAERVNGLDPAVVSAAEQLIEAEQIILSLDHAVMATAAIAEESIRSLNDQLNEAHELLNQAGARIDVLSAERDNARTEKDEAQKHSEWMLARVVEMGNFHANGWDAEKRRSATVIIFAAAIITFILACVVLG